MSKQPRQNHQQGFTLIEIIITLLVFAILASMLVTVLGSSFINSSQPIFRLQETMSLQQTMENMRADYSDSDDIDLLYLHIGLGEQDNQYGKYEVISRDYITFSGAYTDSLDTTGTNDLLKVTIKDPGSGMVMTNLFVRW